MSKKCERVRQLFSPYRDGDLGSAPAREMHEHLETCSDCATRYQHFQDALHDLRTLPRHPVPRQFAAELLQQVTATEGGANDGAATPSRDAVDLSRRGLERRRSVGSEGGWGGARGAAARVATARWAAGVVLGITLVLAWMTWNPDPNMSQRDLVATSGAMTRLDWKRLEARLDQFQGKLEQSELDRDQLLASRGEQAALELKLLRERIEHSEKASLEDRARLEQSIARSVSESLAELGRNLSPQQRAAEQERLTQELLATLDDRFSQQLEDRLGKVDARLQEWQQEMASELVVWQGRVGELERTTSEWVRNGRRRDGEYLTSRRTESGSLESGALVSGSVVATEEPRRYAAIEFSRRSNGALRWNADTTHPSYIGNLFEIYDSEPEEVKQLALAELDKLFAKATAAEAPGNSEFLSVLLLSTDDRSSGDRSGGGDVERQRVETYRSFWNNNLRRRTE